MQQRVRLGPCGWLALPVALLSGVVAAKLAGASSVAVLTRDVTSTAGLSPLTGIVSTCGLFAWAAAATLSLFTSALLRDRSEQPRVRRFLCAAGMFSVILLLDDAFLLHEALIPYWLGIPEHVTFAVYAILAVTLFATHGRVVRRASWPLLAVTVVGFAGSVLMDTLVAGANEPSILIEDGLKFIAVTAWAAMLGDLGFRALLNVIPLADDTSPQDAPPVT